MTLILYPNVILAVRLIRFRICNNSKNKYEKIVSNEFHSVDTMYYIISIHFGFTVLFCSTQYAVHTFEYLNRFSMSPKSTVSPRSSSHCSYSVEFHTVSENVRFKTCLYFHLSSIGCDGHRY